jgi:ParB-like chromosome segregation protein Spo0J
MIRLDGGTQIRAETDITQAQGYAEDMAAGAVFPPIVVFFDGAEFWLADGFHRLIAAEELGLVEISADVREGDRRDAILFAVGANAAHGLKRTNRDKCHAVMTC